MNPNIYVSSSEEAIKDKLAKYLKLSNKYMLKHREYKAVYKIFLLEDSTYSLVFKLVKESSESEDFHKLAVDVYNGLQADKLTPRW
jgi:hypothetical protein